MKPLLLRYSQMIELFNEYGISEYQASQLLTAGIIRKIKLPGGERAFYSREEIERGILQPLVASSTREIKE